MSRVEGEPAGRERGRERFSSLFLIITRSGTSAHPAVTSLGGHRAAADRQVSLRCALEKRPMQRGQRSQDWAEVTVLKTIIHISTQSLQLASIIVSRKLSSVISVKD